MSLIASQPLSAAPGPGHFGATASHTFYLATRDVVVTTALSRVAFDPHEPHETGPVAQARVIRYTHAPDGVPQTVIVDQQASQHVSIRACQTVSVELFVQYGSAQAVAQVHARDLTPYPNFAIRPPRVTFDVGTGSILHLATVTIEEGCDFDEQYLPDEDILAEVLQEAGDDYEVDVLVSPEEIIDITNAVVDVNTGELTYRRPDLIFRRHGRI